MGYKIRVIVFFLLFLSVSLFAQDTFFKHTVLKGETVSTISQKYKVTPNDLYKLNPKLMDGIYENEVILIPKSKVQTENTISSPKKKDNELVSVQKINHVVQPKETKYGLSKQYGLSIEQLEQQNPQIINGLQVGQQLQISTIAKSTAKLPQSNFKTTNSQPSNSTTSHFVEPKETLYGISKRYGLTVDELVAANQDVLTGVLKSGQTLTIPFKNSSSDEVGNFHLVQPGETKYGLSKKYNVSIEELERLNPQIIRMLQSGQQIQIPSSDTNAMVANTPQLTQPAKADEKGVNQLPSTEVAQSKQKEIIVGDNYVAYEVQPKETVYGLSKKAGLTQDQLVDLNPEIANGLKVGMVIKMPASVGVSSKQPTTTLIAPNSMLSSLNKMETKKVAFLMPISEDEFSTWEANPLASVFITNPETKKVTDFYLGSKMAIDSLKNYGVKIEESYYAATDKNALAVVKKNNLDASNLLIYPSNVNPILKIEENLSKNNVPVLSFSTDNENKRTSNSYTLLPTDIQMKVAVLDYLKQNKYNVVVVNDPARKESMTYIQKYYPEFTFADVDTKGMVNLNSLQNKLKVSQKNVIVLDTDKSGLILDTTTFLLKESTNYTIQIAILEPKEKIEKEGLSEMRFKVLKMIHPAFSFAENKNGIEKFKNDFKKKFNYSASAEVIQGFDCTFDALLRLYQNNNFETIAKDERTRQLLHQFQYNKTPMGGYSNSGVYILQYENESDSKRIN